MRSIFTHAPCPVISEPARRHHRRLVWWLGLALAACNGHLDVMDDPVGRLDSPVSQGADDVPSSSSSGADNGASCEDLALNGSREFAHPVACGSCRCEDGATVCDAEACAPRRAIHACPEERGTPPMADTVDETRLSGTTLNLTVKGVGGCGEEDFDVCYRSGGNSIYPPRVLLEVQNRTSEEHCNRTAFQQLEVDLSPLAEIASDQGGLVDAGWLIQVGELTCADRTMLAQNQFNFAQQQIDVRCEDDADCEGAPLMPSCAVGCFLVAANHAGMADAKAALSDIDAALCDGFTDACGLLEEQPAKCSEALAVSCRDGLCQVPE